MPCMAQFEPPLDLITAAVRVAMALTDKFLLLSVDHPVGLLPSCLTTYFTATVGAAFLHQSVFASRSSSLCVHRMGTVVSVLASASYGASLRANSYRYERAALKSSWQPRDLPFQQSSALLVCSRFGARTQAWFRGRVALSSHSVRWSRPSMRVGSASASSPRYGS